MKNLKNSHILTRQSFIENLKSRIWKDFYRSTDDSQLSVKIRPTSADCKYPLVQSLIANYSKGPINILWFRQARTSAVSSLLLFSPLFYFRHNCAGLRIAILSRFFCISITPCRLKNREREVCGKNGCINFLLGSAEQNGFSTEREYVGTFKFCFHRGTAKINTTSFHTFIKKFQKCKNLFRNTSHYCLLTSVLLDGPISSGNHQPPIQTSMHTLPGKPFSSSPCCPLEYAIRSIYDSYFGVFVLFSSPVHTMNFIGYERPFLAGSYGKAGYKLETLRKSSLLNGFYQRHRSVLDLGLSLSLFGT